MTVEGIDTPSESDTVPNVLSEHQRIGFTVWFTDLPGAGKSTLAILLLERPKQPGLLVLILDGDEVRKGLTKEVGVSRKDREENLRRIAHAAKLLTVIEEWLRFLPFHRIYNLGNRAVFCRYPYPFKVQPRIQG